MPSIPHTHTHNNKKLARIITKHTHTHLNNTYGKTFLGNLTEQQKTQQQQPIIICPFVDCVFDKHLVETKIRSL